MPYTVNSQISRGSFLYCFRNVSFSDTKLSHWTLFMHIHVNLVAEPESGIISFIIGP